MGDFKTCPDCEAIQTATGRFGRGGWNFLGDGNSYAKDAETSGGVWAGRNQSRDGENLAAVGFDAGEF
ncbi:hypothetical protein [Campylobacter sp.]|uniref:hypothetical protein n=1 Tax=Campylobacter sp. TaxID=205 RepID=UPI0026DBDB6E|nr:hypothetical protein [Campylobacter sp.]MDO4674726.1 hypothetical protein [Campylobacter sp.]